MFSELHFDYTLQMQSEIERLRQQLSEEQAKTQAADRENKILKLDRKDLLKVQSSLSIHLVGSRVKVRNLETQTDTLERENTHLRDTIAIRDGQIAGLMYSRRNMAWQLGELSSYNQMHRRANRNLSQENRKLLQENQKLLQENQKLVHENGNMAKDLTNLMDGKPILACSVCTHPITSDTGVSVAMPCKHAFCTACSTKFPSQCPCCMLVNPEFVKLIFI